MSTLETSFSCALMYGRKTTEEYSWNVWIPIGFNMLITAALSIMNTSTDGVPPLTYCKMGNQINVYQ